MTRDEFIEYAGNEIDIVFGNRKNRMMNIVQQAWAEGKRNAEIDLLKDAMEQLYSAYQNKHETDVQFVVEMLCKYFFCIEQPSYKTVVEFMIKRGISHEDLVRFSSEMECGKKWPEFATSAGSHSSAE